MVIKLDTVINENYLWKIETKEANLRALQYQINPHFLFNTLEVINSLANQDRQAEIRKVTQGMGKMLRYNLESEQAMTETAMIQKFMLQPIVENIIKHGFNEKTAEGYIEIQTEINNGRLVVSIGDDGQGMDEKRLLEVRAWLRATNQNKKEFSEQNQMGIGLKNIQERIQLLYGNQYGLQVFSEEEKGMTVTITIPLAYEEGGNECDILF